MTEPERVIERLDKQLEKLAEEYKGDEWAGAFRYVRRLLRESPAESDPSSPRPEQGCTCPEPGLQIDDVGIDPRCPVHGRPERCPACCSVERDERLEVTEKEHAIPLGNPRAKLIDCPDPWHSR